MATNSHFPVPASMDTKGNQEENWTFFKEQWQDYEVATGINLKDNVIRMATLRSLMGRDCLCIFKSLEMSNEDRKDPAKSMDELEKYFKPSKNEIYERFQFYTCDQGDNETVDQWVTRLRHLASTCNFGTSLDSMIRDRLVLGAYDKQATARLFREGDVDLKKAVNQLRSSEVAKQQIKEVQGQTSPHQVQYVDAKDSRCKEDRFHRMADSCRTVSTDCDSTSKLCKFCS